MVILDKRLSGIAAFVRPSSVFADIGTDHAYIPIFLVTKGICSKGYASDLRKGPLDSARKNLAINAVTDNIEIFLSDGLKEYKDKKVDDYIIAGMGGELIVKILEEAPFEITEDMNFILQPMSSEEELHNYLFSAGFQITEETAVFDKEKGYIIISAKKTAIKSEKSDIYPYVGELDLKLEESKKYVRKKINSLNKKCQGLIKAGRVDESKIYERLIKKLKRGINED